MKKILLLITALTMAFANLVMAKTPDVPEQYVLKSVVMLSRHNLRTPTAGEIKDIEAATPHKWFKWTSKPGELSATGAQLETLMGRFYGDYLVSKGLFPANYVPTEQEMRFYTNSLQRTIATGRYFASGMLPMADIKMEHHKALNEWDPTFAGILTYSSGAFQQEVAKEIADAYGEGSLPGVIAKVQDNYQVINKVLDIKKSKMYKAKGNPLDDKNITVVCKAGDVVRIKSSLPFANNICDSLVLQYYEMADDQSASFGKKLTPEEWEKIFAIKDNYGEMMFGVPAVATNVAHNTLKEIKKEINEPGRKFTFLGGHDSNLSSTLGALGVEEYNLPEVAEHKAPIGGKFVMEKYQDKNSQEDYVKLMLVYRTTKQIKNKETLSADNPPAMYLLKLKGLKANEDGMYKLADFNQHLQKALDAYDELPKDEKIAA